MDLNSGHVIRLISVLLRLSVPSRMLRQGRSSYGSYYQVHVDWEGKTFTSLKEDLGQESLLNSCDSNFISSLDGVDMDARIEVMSAAWWTAIKKSVEL